MFVILTGMVGFEQEDMKGQGDAIFRRKYQPVGYRVYLPNDFEGPHVLGAELLARQSPYCLNSLSSDSSLKLHVGTFPDLSAAPHPVLYCRDIRGFSGPEDDSPAHIGTA